MKTRATIQRLVKKHTDRIAKERDALRDLISDAEDIVDNCDQAIENLESAVDKLSEYL